MERQRPMQLMVPMDEVQILGSHKNEENKQWHEEKNSNKTEKNLMS